MAILGLILSAFFASRVIAQSPAPTMAAQTGAVAHPAHIHNGTCDQLGDVVYPLNDLVPPGAAGTATAGSQNTMMEATPASGMASGSEGQGRGGEHHDGQHNAG